MATADASVAEVEPVDATPIEVTIRSVSGEQLLTLHVPETDLGADPATESATPEEIEPNADDEFEIVTSGWVDES